MRQICQIIAFFLILPLGERIFAQRNDSLIKVTSVICNEKKEPLAATSVIDMNSGRYASCDSSGVFSLYISQGDSIILRNLACRNITLPADYLLNHDTIMMKTRVYSLKEIKVFEWGSTYADFKNKMMTLPSEHTTGEKLGLPQQTGNPIPNFRNPDFLKSPLTAYTNPVDFLYYNISKKEKSIRKVMEFRNNEEKLRAFEKVYNRDNISQLTHLIEAELDTFMVFLNVNFSCDLNCSDFEITNEIFRVWNNYKLNNKGETDK